MPILPPDSSVSSQYPHNEHPQTPSRAPGASSMSLLSRTGRCAGHALSPWPAPCRGTTCTSPARGSRRRAWAGRRARQEASPTRGEERGEVRRLGRRAFPLPLHVRHTRFDPSGETRRPLVAHCAQLRYPVPVQYTQRLSAFCCGRGRGGRVALSAAPASAGRAGAGARPAGGPRALTLLTSTTSSVEITPTAPPVKEATIGST